MTTHDEPVRRIGSRLEPFLDHFLIERLSDARLELQRPRDAGIALKFDAPWEGLFSGVISVLHDEGRYHMYYRGLPVNAPDGSDNEATCYAHSNDGIHWQKPALGLFPQYGDKNNIILDHTVVTGHNFSPFIDENPESSPEQRYKAVAGLHPKGIFALTSPDGVHWSRLRDEPIITSEAFAFDSQNVPFWSTAEGCYLLYFRTWKKWPDDPGLGCRWISRSTSQDFVHWTAPVEMDMGDTPMEHLYTNQTHPYFRAPHIYIALAARFWPDKKVITDEQARTIGVDPDYYNDCSDGVLMASRGGNRYDRTFLESFLRPGIGAQNWVSRTNYPALGVVPTGVTEMSLYAHRNYGQPTAYAGRFTLRTDGFAAIHAPYSGGELLTKPLIFDGSALMINFSTSAAGSISIEIQDANGQPIPNFTLADAIPTIGDEISRTVAWKRGTDVSALAGRPVRLRCAMRDADLYALQFVRDAGS